jgi:L-aspartate oxidase
MSAPAHVVVVGSGIAGLTTALHASRRGCRVTLVTKDELEHANTRFAQGGIAGVMFDDDRVEDHVRDTLVAGAGLCDPAAVRVLAEEGPARIRELIALGVAFDRGTDGEFVKGLEAAHSYPRILHAGGDATGAAIEKALVAGVRAAGITVIEHAFLVSLRQDPPSSGDAAAGRVTGIELLIEDRTRETVLADAVVLATGGAGQLYAHTTNPPVATGDGIAVALRAGATVADLEFFQFHPTVLPAADDADAFLVSEAVRGEGAVLLDALGHRFLPAVHPDAELAPRDVVARAIATQMERQGGLPVRLDATRLRPTAEETARFLAHRFPTIDAAVRARGLDWARDPVAVTPAAHYLMGGVVTDLWGRTSVPGLYAVGEVARTGVHGANRLASNSLLEGAVFGARAGDVVGRDLTWPVAPVKAPAVPASAPVPAAHGDAEPFTRARLQQLMWEEAGLTRRADGLRRAARTLADWTASAPPARTEAEHEDAHLRLVAAALVAAALARTHSVGAHHRADEPRATAPAADVLAPDVRVPGALAVPAPEALAVPAPEALATVREVAASARKVPA